MSFNPDPLFSKKQNKTKQKNSNITHPVIYFNNFQPQRANQQKHLGIIFHKKLNFKRHIDKILTKTSKGTAVIKRLRNFLLRKLLIAIYKAINRLHLDYGDILYDQPNHASFCQKSWIFSIESSSCNYWCNSRYLPRKTFWRIGSWNT